MSRVPAWPILVMLLFIAAATPGASQQPPVVQSPSATSVPGPLERSAVPVTPDNPIPQRLQVALPSYPVEEMPRAVKGTVTLRVTIDAAGMVAEVRRPFNPDVSVLETAKDTFTVGPALGDAFAKSAIAGVRQWRYAPPRQGPLSFFVRVAFAPGDPSRIVWEDSRRPPMGEPGGVPGGVVAGINAPGPPPPPPPNAPIRIAGTIQPPRKIKDVPPVYPAIAQSARVQGNVVLEATIGTDGRVRDVRVMQSIPLLDLAAINAVRQWEFEPTLLNGQPTAIIMSVTINFKLTNSPAPAAPEEAAPPRN